MKTKRIFVLQILIGLGLWLSAPALSFADSPLTCDTVPLLTESYLAKHVRYRNLNSDLEKRVQEAFVRNLDPMHSLFTQSELDEIGALLTANIGKIKNANCGALFEIHQRLLARYAEVEKYAATVLGDPKFAVDKTLSLQLDPEKRPSPKTEEERLAFQTKMLHLEVSSDLASGLPLDEAKRRIAHRYELATKRVRERKADDIYAFYLNAFSAALDPHSNYLSKDDLDDFKIQMGLELQGIGAALSSKNGYTIVEKIIPGGAADRHKGLRIEDKIIGVGQGTEGPIVDVVDMALRDVVNMIRGKKNTIVRLEILRQSDKSERLTVAITRDTINLEEQAANIRYETRSVNNKSYKLAVLDLPAFYGDTSTESKRQCWKDVEKLLREANENKVDGLVLDLSRNGGGLLEAAVFITGFFIQRGGVVAVQDSARKPEVLRDDDPRTLYTGPMIVLISKATASASEILAGALKDYQRALIVGDDHTFGKGSVQSVLPLPPGLGALKVTTSMFYRPGGRSTQHSGVSSDIALLSIFDAGDFGEKFQPNSLPESKIEPFLSTEANSAFHRQHWTPVTPNVVTQLALRSKARVDQSKDFSELRERIEKAKANAGLVKIEEILKNEKNGKKNGEADLDEDAESKKSPQLMEALNILGDYVYVLQNGSLATSSTVNSSTAP